ncbi:MAG: hypothetical protein WC332_00320 [Clostridia bacterium]
MQGIPDVQGLDALVSETQESTPTQNQPEVKETKTEQSVQTPTEELDLAQFKNPKELLKGYKEIQGTFTRTSQENKTLKEQLAQMNEQIELMRMSQTRPPVQQPQQKDFDQMFLENPQAAVESLAERKAQALMTQSKIQDVLEEENLKEPNEFTERYAYAKLVSQQYPQLVTSTAGVRKLFQLGDKLRAENQKTQAFKAVKAVFGEDVDFEKFKQLIKKDSSPESKNINNAYMPDTSNSHGNQSESNTGHNADAEISAAVSKGDPDGVIAAIFKQQGLR